jgi:hypothetical protein
MGRSGVCGCGSFKISSWILKLSMSEFILTVFCNTMHRFMVWSSALTAALSFVTAGGIEKRDFDVFDYVDPLIGTSSGG